MCAKDIADETGVEPSLHCCARADVACVREVIRVSNLEESFICALCRQNEKCFGDGWSKRPRPSPADRRGAQLSPEPETFLRAEAQAMIRAGTMVSLSDGVRTVLVPMPGAPGPQKTTGVPG